MITLRWLKFEFTLSLKNIDQYFVFKEATIETWLQELVFSLQQIITKLKSYEIHYLEDV